MLPLLANLLVAVVTVTMLVGTLRLKKRRLP
jgi:hypothetical protein